MFTNKSKKKSKQAAAASVTLVASLLTKLNLPDSDWAMRESAMVTIGGNQTADSHSVSSKKSKFSSKQFK